MVLVRVDDGDGIDGSEILLTTTSWGFKSSSSPWPRMTSGGGVGRTKPVRKDHPRHVRRNPAFLLGRPKKLTYMVL